MREDVEMKGKILLIAALAVFSVTAFSGCGFVADGPFGWVYTDFKTPIAVGNAASGEKAGEACVHSYFGMITVGDASIEAAMERSGISDIHTVNRDNFSIFGTYTRQCTLVTGV